MEHGPRYRYALVIYARRSVCECGHAFTFKREARITASSSEKYKRALESMEDTLRGSCKEDGPRTYCALRAYISVYNYNTTIYAFCILMAARRKGSLNTG